MRWFSLLAIPFGQVRAQSPQYGNLYRNVTLGAQLDNFVGGRDLSWKSIRWAYYFER